jgi:hypothetical protein
MMGSISRPNRPTSVGTPMSGGKSGTNAAVGQVAGRAFGAGARSILGCLIDAK